jgi:F-type H+-transporting ATPase subunit b
VNVDWITVSAQIVNFLILVGLLRHFLYQPVMRAMDRREQRIGQRLKDADKREQDANDQAARYQEKQQELERRRQEILDNAETEAERQRRELFDEIRGEAAQVRASWQRQVQQEKAEFLATLRREAAQVIQTAMRKALHDLADAALEDQIIHSFVAKVKNLDSKTRRALVDDAEPVRIASAFELDSTARGRLTRAVHEHLKAGVDVAYEQSPALVCGIELSGGGRRLSWNLNSYLDELSARVHDSFSSTELAEKGT